MYHPIVKELVLPGLQEGQQTNPDTTETLSNCQALVKILKSFPTVQTHANVSVPPDIIIGRKPPQCFRDERRPIVLSLCALISTESLQCTMFPRNRRGSTGQACTILISLESAR